MMTDDQARDLLASASREALRRWADRREQIWQAEWQAAYAQQIENEEWFARTAAWCFVAFAWIAAITMLLNLMPLAVAWAPPELQGGHWCSPGSERAP